MSATVPLDYRINPLDQLRIDVFGEPNLSLTDLPVGPNGKIVLPMGRRDRSRRPHADRTVPRHRRGANRYLRNPQVAVNVTQFTSQKVTVTCGTHRRRLSFDVTNDVNGRRGTGPGTQ